MENRLRSQTRCSRFLSSGFGNSCCKRLFPTNHCNFGTIKRDSSGPGRQALCQELKCCTLHLLSLWDGGHGLHRIENSWQPTNWIHSVLSAQNNFRAPCACSSTKAVAQNLGSQEHFAPPPGSAWYFAGSRVHAHEHEKGTSAAVQRRHERDSVANRDRL